MAKDKHPLILVEWVDSGSLRGWRSITDQDHGVVTIWSAGYLVKETKTEITITTSISKHGDCVDALSIPKIAIKKHTRLKYYVKGNKLHA